MLRARDVMITDLFTVHEGKDFNFVEVMAELHHIRHVPVVDEKRRPVGMLSIRDMLHHLSKAGSSHFIPVRELMTPPSGTASPDDPLDECAKKMLHHRIGALLILEDSKLVGLVSEKDFVRVYAGKFEEE